MNLVVDQAWAAGTLLLWIRLGVLFFMTPVLSGFNGPPAFLALFSLVLAGLLCAGMPAPASAPSLPASAGGFLWAALLEVGLGSVLAFGVHAAFAAFGMAGRILDLQIGFGTASVFDPVTRVDSPVLGVVLNNLAVILFFALDGHHAFIRGVAFSVAQLPPGAMALHVSPAAVVGQFGAIFTLALAMASPVLFMLLLLETGLAVVSRMLPQMNVYFVGLPLKLLAGIAMLAASATAMAPVMARAFASIFKFWDEVLR